MGTEVVQGVAHRYLKRGEAARAVEAVDGVLATVEVVLPVDLAVIDTIASADRDFDRFPGIKRTDRWTPSAAGPR